MFRRSQHIDKQTDPEWNAWWRLGRRLVERRLVVLPMPLNPPYLIAALPESTGWFVLSRADQVYRGVAHESAVIGVELSQTSALRREGGHWLVSFPLALSLGPKGWAALLSHEPAAVLDVPDQTTAVTVIGALGRHPRLFDAIEPQDWCLAARLMRHPGKRLAASQALNPSWGFQFDAVTGEAWWERQDEDSVH